jgi:eukaryotic-like serine/threonine-protein kinase
MDADLERFLRGAAVSPVTEESATQVMRAPTGPMSATAATMIVPPRRGAAIPPPPPPVYYDLEEPMRRRPVWPWVAALIFVLAAGVGGWFLYTQISNKLNSTKPVAVGLYLNQTEQLARQNIKADGFAPVVNHHASRQTARGLVYNQNPIAGKRQPKGSSVTIWVSTGLPKATVPGLVGEQSTDAVAALTRLHLKPDVHGVNSSKPSGEVTAQDPQEGTKITVGQSVRINVSKGPQPIAVANVLSLPLDQATSTLQAQGFQVSPRFVNNDQPANTVINQSPGPGASAGKGTVISLTVSKGPRTSTVPDVTSYDLGTAEQTLKSSGFRDKVVYQPVSDPNSDGVVLSETPQGGTQAPKNTEITLTVGQLSTGDTTTGTTTTTP